MEVINTILSILSSSVGIATAAGLGPWLKSLLKRTYKDTRSSEILRLFAELGCVSEDAIRKLVEAYKFPTPLTREQRDELILLLTNLSRGARFHSTHGTPLSVYIRCERLIDHLLTNIQPVRKKGEPVGPGWGAWQLTQFLGMGAFGEVWKGESANYPWPRAFKFFTLKGAKEWLEKEQQVLFQVAKQLANSANVIDFLDVVIDKQRWPFLVLEYVGGGSLEDWILTHPKDRFPLSRQTVLEGIARGLAEAHAANILHRDLKPANILLTAGPDALPKIADFGLSKTTDKTAPHQVSQGVVVGTQMYLPPEASSLTDPRSAAQDDVFAFGVIWYQLLVGRLDRPPYDFVEQLQLLEIDSRTIRLLSRCLAHPERRFKDGGELLAALEDDSAPVEWEVPGGCFDVGYLASEYLNSLAG